PSAYIRKLPLRNAARCSPLRSSRISCLTSFPTDVMPARRSEWSKRSHERTLSAKFEHRLPSGGARPFGDAADRPGHALRLFLQPVLHRAVQSDSTSGSVRSSAPCLG